MTNPTTEETKDDDVKEGIGCLLFALAVAVLFLIAPLIRLVDRLYL